MTDTDRLAAALVAQIAICQEHPEVPAATWAEGLVLSLATSGYHIVPIAADPTLICPDPADHELAAAVRPHAGAILLALRWRVLNPRWEDEHEAPLREAIAAITAAMEDKP